MLLPSVTDSFKSPHLTNKQLLPSLTRTGKNFNQPPVVPNRREAASNQQRVASRRTSTRQKAEIQANRAMHSRQRVEQYNVGSADYPQNVYAFNMNSQSQITAKISPENSQSKIVFQNFNPSQIAKAPNTPPLPIPQNSFKIK